MKTLKLIVILVIVVALVAVMFACTSTPNVTNNVSKPTAGDLKIDTVYAYAKEAGYTGTLEELIEAFKGDNAYAIAKANGYVGTEKDWLSSLIGAKGEDGLSPNIGKNGNWWLGETDLGVKATGKDGVDGKSAYEIVVEQGYEGTLEEWLLSLVGKNGADGKDGVDGKSAYELAVEIGYEGTLEEWLLGLAGKDGVDGKSAYELAVENGYKGTVEEWLASLIGENGKDGDDGINGINGKSAYELAVEIGYDGTLEEWLLTLVGKDGTNGTDGDDGIDGENGRGIVSIEKTATNDNVDTYTITYTDSTTSFFSVTNFVHTPVTVTFDADGGIIADYTEIELSLNDAFYIGTINANTAIANLPVPTKENLHFIGWFTGTTVNDGQWLNNTTVSEGMTLYARYVSHTLSAWTTTVEKTCLSQGEETRYCTISGCDYSETQRIPMSHNLVWNDLVPSTCVEIGIIEHYHCIDCKKNFAKDALTEIDDLTIALISHNDAVFGRCSMCNASFNLALTLSEDKTYYTVSGIGTEIDDFIAIPDKYNNIPITAIAADVFKGNKSLIAVSIPNTVTSIGDSAFYGCTSLTNVSIPNSVTSIGSSAFYGCSSLSSEIIIPSGVTTIGASTFYNCSSLTSVIIPNGVTSIGSNAFYGCINLKRIIIPESVTTIENNVLGNCPSLEDITIPALSYTYTYSYPDPDYNNRKKKIVYYYTSIARIFGSQSYDGGNAVKYTYTKETYTVLSTGQESFQKREYIDVVYYVPSALKKITITKGEISANVFKNCSNLTDLIIGSAVTEIGAAAFDGCTALTNVYYNGTSTEWANISIDSNNTSLTNATLYYYSETEPTLNPEGIAYDGNYWHYVDGLVTVWVKEDVIA